jgi:hypothetical protein
MATPVPNAGVRPHREALVDEDAVSTGTLTDADFRGCRWIEGNPSPLRRGMFCGLPVVSGESWCARHRGVVFGENSPADFRPEGVAEGPAAGWKSRQGVGSSPAPSRLEH